MPTYSILLFLLICHDKPLQMRSVLAEVKKDQLTEEKKQNETEDRIKMEMEKVMKKVNGFETKEGMKNSRPRRKLLPRETYLVKAEVDGTATLPCKFTMKSDIFWRFQQMIMIIYIDGNVRHFHKRVEFIGNLKKGNASISIKDLHFNDSGEYICDGIYPSGGVYVDENVLVNLHVTVKSNTWANDMKIREQRGVVGGTTTLPCHAPPEEQQHVDFEWTFVNETNVIIDYTNDEIDNEGYERVKFIGDLTKGNASITIEDLRLDDSGLYSCEWTYYSQGPREKHTLVNLTITATASPQNCSSHIVAAVVVTLVMVISVAVAVAVYFCKRKNWFCWSENIKNITAEENIPMNVPSSNNGKNDGEKEGDDGGVQTSLASDLEHNHVDVT